MKYYRTGLKTVFNQAMSENKKKKDKRIKVIDVNVIGIDVIRWIIAG